MVTDNQVLESFLREAFPQQEIEGEDGQWTVRLGEAVLMVVTDEAHNRMRIIMPVVRADELDPDDLRIMLEANFDRALDARYAIRQDIVWAAFIHPLAELTRREFQSALRQVQALRGNYGTSYSSGELIFAPEEQQEPNEDSGNSNGNGRSGPI